MTDLIKTFTGYLNSISDEEWRRQIGKYEYVPTEEDLRYKRVIQLFADIVRTNICNNSVTKGQICEILNLPLTIETSMVYSALGKYFEEIFGEELK